MTGSKRSAIHKLPSLPVAMPNGLALPPKLKLFTKNCVAVPLGVTWYMELEQSSANQMLPSGPVVILSGQATFGGVNSVTTPAGVMLPILAKLLGAETRCVNHRLPSGPAVMKFGSFPAGAR